MFLFLFCSLAIIKAALSYDFHLIKTSNIPSVANVTDIASLKNESIGIISGDLSNCTVTILNGTQVLLKLQESGLVSPPKINSSGSIIFNKGNEIVNNIIGFQNRLETPNNSGDMLLGQNISYIYYSSAEKCPTLHRLNIEQNITISKTFDTQQNCSFYSAGYLARDPSSPGSIVYAAKNKLYFVDSLLNFRNNYIQPNQTLDYQYSDIDSYFDNTTHKLNLLVKYSGINFNNYRLIQKNEDQFTSFQLFYNPTFNLYMKQLQQGVSINKNQLYYWKNLINSTLITDFQTKNQSLQGTYALDVSNNQSLFMQVVTSGQKLVLYKLEGFNITKLFQMEFLSVDFVVYGKFTKDNNNFLFTAAQQIGLFSVCNLDLNQRNYSCLDYYRANEHTHGPMKLKTQLIQNKTIDCNNYLCEGVKLITQKNINKNMEDKIFKRNNLGAGYYDCDLLTLFSDADRFIAICVNYTSSAYEIHLYSITTAQLKATTMIDISGIANITGFRFLVNEVKESVQDPSPMSFMIIFKVNGSYSVNDDAVSVQYNVQNDKFVRTSVRSTQISFLTCYAFGNYIVSFKSTYTPYNNSIKVFDYKTMNLLRSIPVNQGSMSQNYKMEGSKKLLTITHLYDLRVTYVFDLSLGVQDEGFLRGITFIQYFTDITFSYLLLPNQGYIYLFRSQVNRTNQPLKQVYNLQQPPIGKIIPMQAKYDITSTLASIYLKKDQNVPGRQCGLVFSVLNNKKLMKFKDCQPYSNAEYYDVDVEKKINILKTSRIFQSAQKQHIVIVLTQTTNKFTLIQVRNISNPNHLIWSYNRTTSQLINFATYYDNNGSDKIILNFGSYLINRNIKMRIDANSLDIDTIQNYEVEQKCQAISGKKLGNVSDSVVMINKLSTSYTNITLLQENIRILALSQDCNKIALVTGNNKIIVDNIAAAPVQILNQTATQVKDVKFIGVDTLLVEKNDGNVYLIHLNTSLLSSQIVNLFNVKTAVNRNGDLYAVLVDQITVRIYTLQEQLIRQFHAQIENGSLIGLSFSDDNTLNLITQDATLFVLSPTPCPQTFININGYCLCKQNQSQESNVCKCKKNFYVDNEDCICNTQEFIYNNTDCFCSINASQVNNTCVCRTNFVKFGAQCLCNQNEFQFKGSLCLCNYYAKQVDNKCECLQNFVKKGNQCQCPKSFQLISLNRECACNYGFVENNQCIKCSFPCDKCYGSGFSCDSYSPWFYVIIVVGSLLVIAIFGIAIFRLKKNRKRNMSEQDQSLLNSKDTNQIDPSKK